MHDSVASYAISIVSASARDEPRRTAKGAKAARYRGKIEETRNTAPPENQKHAGNPYTQCILLSNHF